MIKFIITFVTNPLIFTIVNSTEIILRLKQVLDYYKLTSSSFADTIDIQRSTMSHLLSGRNKPSLDFVLKVVDKFPEVNLYWFLKGKGKFPSMEQDVIDRNPPSLEEAPSLFSHEASIDLPSIPQKKGKELIKIILLYNDGSFENFDNNTFPI
ncbi:helix-turn-helix domain-containing protein [Tenacibaculum maritimum]|uniref:helix-turn-helix domain-containing protein n=1 Tax=Tenacibaculum maritimum TaxID=107401 RepID=UPI003876A94A